MASINGYDFIYGNVSSEEIGVILCNFGSSSTSNNDEKSEIIMTTTPSRKTWSYHYKKKTEPLQFPITLARPDGTYFDTYGEREIKKVLCKEEFDWFQVNQDDMANIFYRAIIYDPSKEDVGKRSAGLNLNLMCDSGNAWSELKKKNYTTVNGTLDFKVYLDIDFDKYEICPLFIITSLGAGTVSITNSTTNQTVSFTGCSTNEIITLDNETDKVKSSTGQVIINRWNKRTISLREGMNNIQLTGNFKLEMQYRLPIRVGG